MLLANVLLTSAQFHVRHFNNVFEQSWCHCRVGATPASRSNCLQTCRIHHQVKYRRKNANTCIEAAILFSGHPYIGRHYRATLIFFFFFFFRQPSALTRAVPRTKHPRIAVKFFEDVPFELSFQRNSNIKPAISRSRPVVS